MKTRCKSMISILPRNKADRLLKTSIKLLRSMVTNATLLINMFRVLQIDVSGPQKLLSETFIAKQLSLIPGLLEIDLNRILC